MVTCPLSKGIGGIGDMKARRHLANTWTGGGLDSQGYKCMCTHAHTHEPTHMHEPTHTHEPACAGCDI